MLRGERGSPRWQVSSTTAWLMRDVLQRPLPLIWVVKGNPQILVSG